MQNDETKDIKPLKLEQPYSVIYQRNMEDDPNNLGSWERPPHNSSKITRQNLDDAVAVRNAFNHVYDETDGSNSMVAPEGNSNDYFLKAKDNLVGRTNDRHVGSFLDRFHGMDFFKRGVPEMEKGLKGTGYDMGPSANIANSLKEAMDKDNTEEASKEVENIIEEHPEESQEVLPEDTPIQEEAEQITEDDDKRNDEVNNEVVEDFVEENTRFKDLENKPYYEDWVNSKPGSEQFMNAYNSVVRDYGKEEADQQLKDWNIELPKDEGEVSDIGDIDVDNIDDFEAYARKADEEVGSSRRAEAERKRAFNEKLGHNNQEAWKDYALETGRINTRGDIRKGFETEVGKSILAEIMTPEEWMNDSLREGVLRHTKYTRNPAVVRNNLRESIAKEKKALGIDEETLRAKEEAKRQEEAKQKEEEKKRRDEAWAKLMADDKSNDKRNDEAVSKLSEDFDTVDDLYNYLIDWDKVKVYEPGEEMYPGEHSNDWENEPDFDTSYWDASMGENPLPEGERPNLHEEDEAIDRMQDRLDRDEDFAGPDELPATYDQFVEPGKELALTNGNELASIEDAHNAGFSWEIIDDQVDEAVDNDETIPEDKKEETKKRRHKLIKWLKGIMPKGNSKSITGGSNVPSEKTDISTKQSSSNIQSAGKDILGNIGASSGVTASRIPSVKEEKKPTSGSTASRAAGGGSMPVANEGNYAAVSHSNGGNMSSGSAGSGMFGKVGTLGKGGAIASKKSTLPGGESKGGSSVLQSPQGAKNSSTDMNILSLRDKIIAKSKTWPGQRLNKDGLLIVVRDDNRVFINRQLFENFIKDNPKSVQYLRQIVDKY